MKYLFLNNNDYFNDDCSFENSKLILYIRKNKKHIKSFVVDGKKYLVDTLSLSVPCCYDVCLDCVNVHGSDCCSGSPYSFDDNISKSIDDIFPKMVAEGYISGDKINFINKHGYYTSISDDLYGMFEDGVKTIRNDGTYCVFHETKNNESFCILHRYALHHNINPYDLKPPCCFMLPLDVVELDDGSIFIFGFCEGTIDFSRWFSELIEYPCLNGNIKKEYKPLYLSQENFIRHFFSDELFEKICSIMNNGGDTK